MRIQFFSDMHLEFGGCVFPVTDADIVVAAGDIGVGTNAVDWLAQAPCPVIYVAGNHEYYGGDLEDTYHNLDAACSKAQIDFLEHVRADMDKVRFLGTTLWTDYNGGDDSIMHAAEQGMNDFYYIQQAGEPLTAEKLLKAHRQSLDWLESELAQPFDGQTVVVTHHAPTLKSWYNSADADKDVRRYAYCNQLDDLIKNYDIALWIHGHIHSVSDYRIGGTQVVANPRGYHGHQDVDGYDPYKIIEI